MSGKSRQWSSHREPPKAYGTTEHYIWERRQQAKKPLFLVRSERFPDIVVRASSPYDAACEAAFWLGADWMELRGAETVWVPDEMQERFFALEAEYGYVKRTCLEAARL